MSWDDYFSTWASPLSQTEEEKCANSLSAVKKAIEADTRLSKMDISIFPQGSFRARTNVKQSSDVDICVCLNPTFFERYPDSKNRYDYGNVDGSITFYEYKNIIEEALNNRFGSNNIKRGHKAFDIHENSYRIDADVVPAFSYRYYFDNGLNQWITPEGIAFYPDDKPGLVINWPEQTYINGVAKNDQTGRRYKSIVRILKKLRDDMQEDKIADADDIASFLIESMVWNVPDNIFGGYTYRNDVREVVAYAYNQTVNDELCSKWLEVNKIKYLFHPTQPWDREKANKFLFSVWNYLEFE